MCRYFISYTINTILLLLSINAHCEVYTCDLGYGHLIKVEQKEVAYEEYRYLISIDGKTDSLLYFGGDINSDSAISKIEKNSCLNNIYTFAVSYGPPYNKGIAVRFNKEKNSIERIDFAEKGIPLYIQNNKNTFSVIIPNLNEGKHQKFIRYTFNKNSPDSHDKDNLNTLPKSLNLLKLQ